MKTKDLQKMNIVIVGHVDHGKSTVIGRLLADTHSLPEGKLDKVKAECKRTAKPFEYAFLLDALKDEQSQGITIDSARCFFKSQKRGYIIIDAPGHIEFLKNMISGAARAEAALLVIDAKEGIRENSKRHGYLLSMLGIKQVAVCVNKMDLVDYDQKVFDQIEKKYRAFLKKIGITPKYFLPIAAREGDNIVTSSPNLKWYKGKSILQVLDGFEKAPSLDKKPLRLPVQAIYRFTESGDDRRIVAGRVESGSLAVGDEVLFLPSNKRSQVASIEAFAAGKPEKMQAGYSTGVTLKEQIYINRGDVMCKLSETHPLVSSIIKVDLFWMSRQPLTIGKEYKLKIGTVSTPMWVKEIRKIIDASDLRKAEKKQVERHDVAECILECRFPIAFDLSSDMEATGRFVIVDEYDISGGGIISAMVKDEQAKVREEVLEREINWDFSIIDPNDRKARYGHRSKFVLLTGPAGVNKKEIAKHLEKSLFEMGCRVYFLPFGNVLRGLDSSLETHRRARSEQVRRLGETAHLFMDAGLIVVATATNLNDDELKLLQEVTDRNSMYLVNVGKSAIQEGMIDLALKEKSKTEENVKKCLELLFSGNVLSYDSSSL